MKLYTREILAHSILELPQLEKLFEEKAANGLMIKNLSFTCYKAKYDDIPAADYHFSIGAFGRPLSPKVKKRPEFQNFKNAWESCGWQFACSFQNLAVFYSGEKDRPPAPEEERNFYKGDFRLTAKLERLRLVAQVLGNLLWFLFIMSVGARHTRYPIGAYWDKNSVIFIAVLLLCTLPLILSAWALETANRQHKVLRELKADRPVPEVTIYWEHLTILVLSVFLSALACAFYGITSFNVTALRNGGIVTLGTALVLYWFYLDYRHGKKEDFLIRGGVTAAAFIAFLVIVDAGPFPRDYRFENSSSKRAEWNDPETAVIVKRGLSPEELGWAEESYSFYEKNYHLLCREEQLIYHEEIRSIQHYMDKEAGSYRYIGTIRAKLKAEKDRNRYLNSKRINMEESIPINVNGRMSYYLAADQKTIVGIMGTDIVLYFLNSHDERTFGPEDEKLITALQEKEQFLAEN